MRKLLWPLLLFSAIAAFVYLFSRPNSPTQATRLTVDALDSSTKDFPKEVSSRGAISPPERANEGTARPKKTQERGLNKASPEEHGDLIPIAPNLYARAISLEEYKKQHPAESLEAPEGDDYKIPGNTEFLSPESKVPEEKFVPFSKLSTNCDALRQLQFPVALRINSEGAIVEAAPMLPIAGSGRVPASVMNCTVTGGGDAPFVTNYLPDAHPAIGN